MSLNTTANLLFSILIAGCSAAPVVAPIAADQLWQDRHFAYNVEEKIETKHELFSLDSDFTAVLAAKGRQESGFVRRLEILTEILFSPKGINIQYSNGHSTGAAETWRNKQGDCLSLTMLTYAAAKALGIDASMQEVRVPVGIDRRDGVDFVSGHVNVLFPDSEAIMIRGRSFPAGAIVIDFEPKIGSFIYGNKLSEDQILARFYNNRAAEFLVANDDARAYAYFKAALNADPRFSSAYSNLALLYQRRGLAFAAEIVLRHAIALNDASDVPLRTLHDLLSSQGRTGEAIAIAAQLKRHQESDPYYWLNIGLDRMQNNYFGQAIDALERAESLTTGFEEIHRYLAIAYWRNGQQKLANKELATLVSMRTDDQIVKSLSRKLGRSPHEISVQ